MKHGGIISAAIEVIAEVETRHRPATEALRDWGLSNRFAGSGDRAAIGNLVFDALRRRASIAWRMGADTPRALVLGAYGFIWGNAPEEIEAVLANDSHAPAGLDECERAALANPVDDDAPPHIRGDYPDWLRDSLERAFGGAAPEEGRALAERAPLDLRVNTLKTIREKVLKALARFTPVATSFSKEGVRIQVGHGPARPPHVTSEAGYRKGWFEIQDEASQLVARLAGAERGMQVADVCAGAGGKTLALAAAMGNTGQVHAWDADRRRLANIHERIQRAGARNVQVLKPGEAAALESLAGRMNIVLVDAPCSGSGTWRRRPDAKWRLSERALAERQAEQAQALETGAPLVRPGGRLVYATCSVLPEENEDQIARFLEAHPEFTPTEPQRSAAGSMEAETAERFIASVHPGSVGILMTPLRTGTDGFFVSVLERRG